MFWVISRVILGFLCVWGYFRGTLELFRAMLGCSGVFQGVFRGFVYLGLFRVILGCFRVLSGLSVYLGLF